MDDSAFDTLTRRVAGQTTRRSALGALLGGALLLGEAATAGANKQAKRRKARSVGSLKPASVRVYNYSKAPVTVIHGEHGVQGISLLRCWDLGTFTINPNTDMVFRSRKPDAYLILDNTATLQFDNPVLAKPNVSAVQNGVYYNDGVYCPRWGTLLLGNAKMDVGTTRDITIGGKIFRVNRGRDTNYKEYRVWVGLML